MRSGNRAIERHRDERGDRRLRDHRGLERWQLGRYDGALGVVARAHRRLGRLIALVIRTMAIVGIRATTGLDDRDRSELRHRHGERYDDRDHGGRDPGRRAPEASGVHHDIPAPPRDPVNVVDARVVAGPCAGDPAHARGNAVRSPTGATPAARGAGRRGRSIATAAAAADDRSSRSPRSPGHRARATQTRCGSSAGLRAPAHTTR